MPQKMSGVGSCSGFLQTLSISLAVYLWEKELTHVFSGHGFFAEVEDGFWKDGRARCSHTSEEITSPPA